MTQEFRLLTGVHAGARLELNAPTMTLGRSAHADIVINDWSGPEMQLVLEPDGGITLNAVDGSQPAITLASLVPQRFGPVVLCTGPTGAPWPSDLELLQSLLSPTATALQAATRPLSMSRSRVIAALLGISTAVALALWSGLPPQAASHPESHASLTELRTGLAQLNLPEIELSATPDGFRATGIAPDTARSEAAHHTLRELAGTHLVWQVKSATDIAQQLQESLHDEPSIQVRYLGQGRFALNGQANHPDALRQSAARFRADLAPTVADVTVQVSNAAHASADGEIESMLSSAGLRYVESSDGAKNFGTATPAPSTSSTLAPLP